MEGHIYNVKAKSEARNIRVKDIMTTARDHENLRIFLENSAGKSAAMVTYLSMRIHPKSCCIFPLKVSATLLNCEGREQLQHIKATC